MHRLAVLLWPLGWVLARLPSSWLMALGAGLGQLQRRLSPQRVRVARRNLELCLDELDETDREQILHQTLSETGRGIMEMVLATWGSDRRLCRIASIDGLAHYQQAVAGDRPVLVYFAHFTSVELAGRLLNLAAEQPAALVVRRQSNPTLERLIDRGRRRHARRTIEKKDLKGLLRTLREQPVFYGFDQHFSAQTVWSSLFGVPAATLTTPARLAARCDAQVLSAWCHRDERGQYQLRIDPPWSGYPSGDPKTDADRYNAWLESRIREHPAQYLWLHRRFRQPLPDGRSLYADSVVRAKHRRQ